MTVPGWSGGVGCSLSGRCFPKKTGLLGQPVKREGPFGMCDAIYYISPGRPWIKKKKNGGTLEIHHPQFQKTINTFSNSKAQLWMFYEDPYIVLSKSKFSYAVAVLGLNKFVILLKAHTD